MKNKIGLISLIIFLVFSFVVAVYQDSQKRRNLIEFPDIEDVVSAVIDIGGPPHPDIQPIQMDLNNNMQKLTVAKIIYWLTHAEYTGPPRKQLISYGGGPNEFVLTSKDGKVFRIIDAFDPISIGISNGGMASGISVSDQVTITYENKSLRFKSPGLKHWIETDMNEIIEERLKEQQKGS